MLMTEITPEIGIANTSVKATVNVLTQVLSDEHVLYIKLRNYHWNVTGPHFAELHRLFAEQYGVLANHIDDVAERIRMLGSHTPGTMAEYLQRTALRESAGRTCTANEMLHDLLTDHESIVQIIGESLGLSSDNELDLGSSDLLIQVMRDHEKMAWMLRSTLTAYTDSDDSKRRVPYSVLYE